MEEKNKVILGKYAKHAENLVNCSPVAQSPPIAVSNVVLIVIFYFKLLSIFGLLRFVSRSVFMIVYFFWSSKLFTFDDRIFND